MTGIERPQAPESKDFEGKLLGGQPFQRVFPWLCGHGFGPFGFEVCKVKDPKDTETGVANAAGVVPGQRLLEIEIALPDPRQLKLIRSRVGREGKKITEWWVEQTMYRKER